MSQTDDQDKDDWPAIQKEIDETDILILCTSVWLGEKSSVCNRILEKMHGYTHLLNEKGQYRDYGKVGATLITGNEDGIKHCAMNILFSLSYIGYTIPPQSDAGGLKRTVLHRQLLTLAFFFSSQESSRIFLYFV